MSEENVVDQGDTFSKMGRTYQEKVVQALMQDYQFAEQMADILNPKFFDLKYLQELVNTYFDYKKKYKTYPSPEVMEIILTKETELDSALVVQIKEYLARAKATPINGDMGFLQESSLEFCKKQALKEGLVKAIDKMESGKYDEIRSVINEALNRGGPRDLGHEYMEGFDRRRARSKREAYPTGWPILDKYFNGGWKKQILVTFIAPTGAGKSHFLVNCGAGGIANGMNVVHFTLELAEEEVGLRYDAYFSGVEINHVPDHPDKVEAAAKEHVKGRLIIKGFPTKTASVQTLRAYLQRLASTKNFKPDMIVVDYADLLRGSGKHGDKRFELEGVYEELRALSQELDCIVITADQTNRAGLEMEVVTIAQIGEAYAKATVCDVIMTVSRKMEDKQSNCGRLFVAKSRLGRDGMVIPFMLNTSTVKVRLLQEGDDPIAMFMNDKQNLQSKLSERVKALADKKVVAN